MKPMTPEDARLILDGADESGIRMSFGAWRALETIAGMREEWGIVATYLGRHEVEEWGFDTREEAEAEGTTIDTEYRVVRRYVTTEEEA